MEITTSGKVAVLGAGGFIGGHVARELENQGVDVVIPVKPSGARMDICAEPEDMAELLAGVDVVINAAGRAHLHSANPADFWPSNAEGARRVAAAAALTNSVRRLVHVSSAAVGSGGLNPPVSLNPPITAYGAAKAAGELGVALALTGSPIDLVVVRPAGVGGIDSPGSWGTIWRRIRDGVAIPVPVNDIRHDVVEIEEVVSFIARAATGGVSAGVYGLPGPSPVTIVEYAEKVAARLRTDARTRPVPGWALGAAQAVAGSLTRVTRPAARVLSVTTTLNDQRDLMLRDDTADSFHP